jgi:hypothetical protein
METVECRYRGRVIVLLYPNSKGQLAYRTYHRPTEADMIRAQMQMNDPNPFSRIGGYSGPDPFMGVTFIGVGYD